MARLAGGKGRRWYVRAHEHHRCTQPLQNFIDGEFVDAGRRRDEPVLNPATGEEIAEAPLSGASDVDRAVAAARARLRRAGPRRRPASARSRCCKLADAIEEHGDELAELEAANAGKPIEAVKDDEIPVMVDNLRFFAGAARCMEGKAAGEYLEGYTSMHPPRAGRRRRPDRAVELPADDGRLEDRPGAGDRQHDRAQARAETTPLTTLRLAELAAEILPKGVLNVVAAAATTPARRS